MALNNGWGAPRIHAELIKLGFNISETSVSRYMPRRPPAPGARERWLTFLRHHMDCTVAMDLFTVPTVRLRQLYCFFVIHHGRRHPALRRDLQPDLPVGDPATARGLPF